MKKLITALFMLPAGAMAMHMIVDVTPQNIKKYELAVTIKAIEKTVKTGDKPAHIAGHAYQVTVKSQKVNLRECYVGVSMMRGNESYLSAGPLERDPFALKAGFIFFTVNFSPDYLNDTSVIIQDRSPGADYSYKLKIKDWITHSEQTGANDTSFTNLQQAVDYVAASLEATNFIHIAEACLDDQRKPNDSLLKYLQGLNQKTPLRTLYVGKSFPTNELNFELGGHMTELGSTHIDFIQTNGVWKLQAIWTGR